MPPTSPKLPPTAATGHTAGPWTIRPNDAHRWDNNFQEVCVLCNTSERTGVVIIGAEHAPFVSPLEKTSDAHLIAAAPDLLGACRAVSARYVIDVPEDHADFRMITAVRAAIAKAEGRQP